MGEAWLVPDVRRLRFSLVFGQFFLNLVFGNFLPGVMHPVREGPIRSDRQHHNTAGMRFAKKLFEREQ
jgi:hypothetical protein